MRDEETDTFSVLKGWDIGEAAQVHCPECEHRFLSRKGVQGEGEHRIPVVRVRGAEGFQGSGVAPAHVLTSLCPLNCRSELDHGCKIDAVGRLQPHGAHANC